jgi:Bardet-Biedl syndrome 1 protein
MELTDIFTDGDNKFVAACFGLNKGDLKLKVFKGATLIKENNLVDSATAILSFYMDNLQPRVPGDYL